MGYLTREQIRAAKDRKTKSVPVPEWGGDVLLISMTVGDRERVKADENREKALKDGRFMALVLSKCLVGEDLKPLFSERDLAELAEKDNAVIERLVEQAIELSGLAKGATAAAEKNSEPTPNGSSSST